MKNLLLVPGFVLLLAGCTGEPPVSASTPATAAADAHAGHDHSHDHGPAGSITLNATAQANLGITFATAGYRVVQGTLRLPGQFVAEPTGRRTYQMPLAGQVELLVRPFQQVAVGDPLYRLTAAGWHALQQELAEAMIAAEVASDRNAANQAQITALTAASRAWDERIRTLEQLAGTVGGKAADLAEARVRLQELQVQLSEAHLRGVALKREAHDANGSPAGGRAALRLRQLLLQAEQITGVPAATLATVNAGVPQWQTLSAPVITAQAAGIVEGELATSGSWLSEHATVLTVTDPSAVRLQAHALQADLPRLRAGLPSWIVAADPHDPLRIPAKIVLAPVADPVERSAMVIARPDPASSLPPAIRPGITALLEVVVSGSAEEELAIPVAATIRDGLQQVFFRRHRTKPELVERVEADLGASDGRWVVVNSGLKEGDAVVVGGIYPLKLALQSGGATPAGHFEADGTFHVGSH